MKRIITTILILSVFVLSSCTPSPMRPQRQGDVVTPKASSIFKKGNVEQIKITADKVPCRTGASTNYPVVKTLEKGNVYDVMGEMGDWYVVKTEDGRVGAVEQDQAKPHVDQPSMAGQQENLANLTPNEEEMTRLLNGERSKAGLNPLKVDMEIVKVARLKSQDMIDNNYFSHNSPTYGSPFDMMKQFGIKYVYAGENLAGNQTVQAAHDSLMNSEGHRKNILSTNFTHIGIGVKEGGKYGKMFTQMFVGR
ncbi:MAG: CAP domain-containing protein [Bacillota bacterium]